MPSGGERLIANHRRVAVKIGSALLVDSKGRLRKEWLDSVADDLAALNEAGCRTLVISSGAIALGSGILGEAKRTPRLEDDQAAAACGQIALARAWSEALGERGLRAGQILLTLGDTEERRRYLNARATLATLLRLGAIPLINENDTVATNEIRYGDNDRLAARVAVMSDCDLLILLSDVDGLYSSPPGEGGESRFIERIERITPEVEAMAGGAGTGLSRGGMATKIEAARIATQGGARMAIASGRGLHPLSALDSGGKASWFEAKANPASARKKWIAGRLRKSGALLVDEGAARALAAGKSLLPAGVRSVEGDFARGDVVRIRLAEGEESDIGCGVAAYDRDEAERIAGCNSERIEAILGHPGRAAMIHRDDMALYGKDWE